MPRRADQVAELRIELAEQARRLAVLEAALAAAELVPLKAVAVPLSYEAARVACRKGLVRSERRGGRLFVDADGLAAYANRKPKK
jgi:hypothetical protein